MNKNDFLKRILTTASIASILATASIAEAKLVTVEAIVGEEENAPAFTNTPANFGLDGEGGNVVANGDSILLNGIRPLVVNSELTLAGIGVGAGELSVTIAENATIGSIAQVGNGGIITAQVNDGVTLMLNGAAMPQEEGFPGSAANNYDALGAVTIGSSAEGGAATLNIDIAENSAVFTNTFDAFNGNTKAILTVSNDANVFGGNIGNTSQLAQFNINGHTIVGGNNTTVTNISSTATTIANNKTLTLDSSANNIIWNGAIDGPGNLSVIQAPQFGASSMHFHNNIGADTALNIISFGDRTSIYMNNQNIKASIFNLGASSAIYNPGVITVSGEEGITLTGDSVIIHDNGDAPVINAESGINIDGHKFTIQGGGVINASLSTTGNGEGGGIFEINGGDVTLGGSIGGENNRLTVVNFASNNALIVTGGHSIYSDITTSKHGHGSLGIENGNVILDGDVGDVDHHLDAINFNSNHSLTISGEHSIYSNISTTQAGTGSLIVNGGDVSIFGNIGADMGQLSSVSVASAHNLTVNGNLYANNILFNHANAQITFLGGNSNTPKIVSGTISNNNDVNGQGTLNVGDGESASYVEFIRSVGENGYAVRYFNIVGNADPSKASTAIISDNVYFDGAGGGIVIGQNATAIVNVGGETTLLFENGATIEGDVEGSGTIEFNNAYAIPVAIGANKALDTVRLNNFTEGVLGNAVNATNIDVTRGTNLELDGNAVHVTNFINSDTESQGSVYYNGEGALTVKNIQVPLMLYNKGSLTVANATKGVTFVNDIESAPTLILAAGGEISDISAINGNAGTVQTSGNATFTGSIGSTTRRLNTLTFSDSAYATVNITSATDIYAENIRHKGVTLDVATHNHNITMHSSDYSMTDGAKLNAGVCKVTVMAQYARLSGNIQINARHNPHSIEQVVLDLSGVDGMIYTSHLASLTFNITNSDAAPVAGNKIVMVKGLSDTIIPILAEGNDPKWIIKGGVATYTIPSPYSPPSSTPTPTSNPTNYQPNSPVGATSANVAVAAQIVSSGNGGSSMIIRPNTTNVQGAAINQPVLNIANKASEFNTLETGRGLLGFVGNEIIAQQSIGQTSIYVTPSAAQTIAAVAVQTGTMSPILATPLLNADTSVSANLVADIVTVVTTGGATAATVMENHLTSAPVAATAVTDASANTTGNALDLLSSRFTNSVNTNIQVTQAVSNSGSGAQFIAGEDLTAAAEGIAAGSTPNERLGVWGTVNLGQANQKSRKGNPGFKSFLQGIAVGVDTMVNDRTTIGAIVSNAITNSKYKDNLSGNKSRASSWVGALYGSHDFHKNWFIRGTALFNKTYMNDKNLKLVRPNVYALAQAKYNLISYGGEANIGLVHTLANQVQLIPTIGARVIHTNKMTYSETGNTNQNTKEMTQEAMNHYSALAGLSVTKTFHKGDLHLIPEAHANFQYGFNAKAPRGSYVSPLSPTQNTNFIGTKSAPLSSTYGASMTFGDDKLECSVSGDVTLAEKYVGYQGALKLKVKF